LRARAAGPLPVFAAGRATIVILTTLQSLQGQTVGDFDTELRERIPIGGSERGSDADKEAGGRA
jgi:hypothetical protein